MEPTYELARVLKPDTPTAIDGDWVATVKVVARGKIRLHLQANGQLARELRAAAMKRNRLNRRGRQPPRSD